MGKLHKEKMSVWENCRRKMSVLTGYTRKCPCGQKCPMDRVYKVKNVRVDRVYKIKMSAWTGYTGLKCPRGRVIQG